MGSSVTRLEGGILAEDLSYETIREDWNVYRLSDGTVLKVKLAALKISRGLEDDGKSIRYTKDGEPYYNIRHHVMVTAEVPPELMKRD